MTFQQLEYLLAAHKANSISKAAEKLTVAPSSVSACINSLEKELGFPIFVRNQKGLVATPKGETVIEYAQRMIKTYSQMTTLREETRQHLRLCSTNYYPYCAAFAQLVAQCRDCEDVTFSMDTDSAESGIRRVSLGELDALVMVKQTNGWWKIEAMLAENNLQWQILKKVPYSICVGPGHRLYNRSSVATKDLHREVLIDTGGRIYGRGFWGDLVEINTKLRISIGNDIALRELLRRGIGYAVQVYPPAEAVWGELKYIPVEGVTATLCIITNPHTPPNPLIERYKKLLVQELDK